MLSSDLEKILKTPPSQLSADDMMYIRFNGFIRNSYFIRWTIDNQQSESISKQGEELWN